MSVKQYLLTELVDSLSKKEYKDCINFIEQSGITNDVEIFDALDCIRRSKKRRSKNTKSSKTSKERQLENQAKTHVEDFLLFNKIKNNRKKRELELLSIFEDRKVHRNFEIKNKKALKNLESTEKKGAPEMEQLYKLEKKRCSYEIGIKGNRKLNMSRMINFTNDSIILEILMQACMIESHITVAPYPHDMSFTKLVVRYVDTNKSILNNPLIAVYYYAYKMISADKESEFYFNNFLNTYEQNPNVFVPEDKKHIYAMGINFCMKKLNEGKREFGKVGLKLSRETLKDDVMLESGGLSIYRYRNIVIMAVRIDEYTWAENFCQEFLHIVQHKDKQSYYAFNMGMINYYKGDFSVAMDHLNAVECNDQVLTLSVRVLQLKIYFENKEWNVLDYHLDAMKVYLFRHKLLGYHKKNFSNIVRLTKAILRSKFTSTQKEKLKQRILKIEPLTERDWMLKQLG